MFTWPAVSRFALNGFWCDLQDMKSNTVLKPPVVPISSRTELIQGFLDLNWTTNWKYCPSLHATVWTSPLSARQLWTVVFGWVRLYINDQMLHVIILQWATYGDPLMYRQNYRLTGNRDSQGNIQTNKVLQYRVLYEVQMGLTALTFTTANTEIKIGYTYI